jgi:hypothetical protein
MEKFDYKGFWWLSNNPDEKLAGICSFSLSEGGSLELIGDFSTLVDFQTLDEPLLILGSTLEGDVTLYNCFLQSKKQRRGKVEVSLYCVNLIFAGIHFHSDSEVRFKSISTHYSFTNEWVNNKTFEFKNLDDEEQVTFKYWDKQAQAKIDENYSLSVEVQCGKNVSFFEKVSLDRKVFLTVEASEDKHYGEYRKVMAHVRNFLTLGITKSVFPLIMNGFVSRDNHPLLVRIIGQVDLSTNTLESEVSWNRMFFTFQDISNKFEPLIKTWFQKAEALGTLHELYFGILENSNFYYPKQEFLSLIQALESYCSQEELNPELKRLERTEEEHCKILTSIMDHAPEEHKGWLKSKLRHSNNLPLSAKLMSLLKSNGMKEIFMHLKKSENSFNVYLNGQLKNDLGAALFK